MKLMVPRARGLLTDLKKKSLVYCDQAQKSVKNQSLELDLRSDSISDQIAQHFKFKVFK